MTSADELERQRLRYAGVEVTNCSAEEWLQLALDSEQTARACGPLDPAYRHFVHQQRLHTDAAALAERLAATGGA